MWSNIFAEILINHKGKFFGIILGLLFGLFLITFGILKAIVVGIFVAIGYFIGKRADEEGGLRNFLIRIFGNL